MAKEIKLVAETRKENGSAQARRMRRDGWLPGIINTKGQSRMVRMNRHDFSMLLRQQKSENVLFDVALDGSQPVKVLLKEVQHDPLSGDLIHADFVEVSMTHKMRVRIPIVVKGEAPGVQAGGILDQVLREVEIECLPGDIVDTLEIDVSTLQLGLILRVSDITLPPGLTVLSDKNAAVATCALPRAEEEAAAEGAEAAAEPEVIGAKKEGEEGEAAAEGADAKKGDKKEGGDAKAAGAKPAAAGKPDAKAAAKPAAGKAEKKPAGK